MTKKSIVSLLVSQSLGYSIPAYITGMIVAQIAVWYMTSLIGKKGNINFDGSLSSNAILLATTVGIGCSLVAAILPIINALRHNLRDVLDVRHSGTKAVEFNLERTNSMATFSWNVLANCSALVVLGWVMYYYLPQSFLSGDLSKIVTMLFIVLLGMLFGFVLIGMNMQHIVELIMVKMVLFWERRPIPNIVVKNLIAHRLRNRKTAVMYSLSLSFVMMVTVMVHSNVETMKMSVLRRNGAHLSVDLGYGRYTGNAILENLLLGTGNFSDLPSNESIHQFVDDFTWRSWHFGQYHHHIQRPFNQVHQSTIGMFCCFDSNSLVQCSDSSSLRKFSLFFYFQLFLLE